MLEDIYLNKYNVTYVVQPGIAIAILTYPRDISWNNKDSNTEEKQLDFQVWNIIIGQAKDQTGNNSKHGWKSKSNLLHNAAVKFDHARQ